LIEQIREFVEIKKSGGKKPVLTSACPGKYEAFAATGSMA
jgi:hypothetical protein